jgi:hypothetical protein
MVQRMNEEVAATRVKVAVSFGEVIQNAAADWRKRERRVNPAAQKQVWSRYIQSRLRQFETR